jgi:PRC-barrel domain
MRLSEIIGARAVDRSGKRIGRVFDVVVETSDKEPTGDSEVTMAWLVVGRRGLLERLGIPAWLSRQETEPKPTGHDRILWDDAIEVSPGRVVVQ